MLCTGSFADISCKGCLRQSYFPLFTFSAVNATVRYLCCYLLLLLNASLQLQMKRKADLFDILSRMLKAEFYSTLSLNGQAFERFLILHKDDSAVLLTPIQSHPIPHIKLHQESDRSIGEFVDRRHPGLRSSPDSAAFAPIVREKIGRRGRFQPT